MLLMLVCHSFVRIQYRLIVFILSGLSAGTPLTLGALQNQQNLGGASGQQQTLYRIPTGQGQTVVALPSK